MSVATGVDPRQRYSAGRTCPICGGAESDKRGQGTRCTGFASDDGKWARCSREEYAGLLPIDQRTQCYAHKLHGDCRCGSQHGPDVIQYPSVRRPTSSPVPKASKPKSSGPPASIVATYDYTDGTGELLYQVLRKSDKGFGQRRPDGEGGWISNLEGIERTIYHLDAIVAEPVSSPVYIAEGEKDVDRLRAQGLVATCNSGGAGKWTELMSRKLRGRKVVILGDNDDPGQKHVEMVAESLKDLAADIRVIDLAKLARKLRLGTLPKKGDVSDLLDMGLTVDQLSDAVATAPHPFRREYATLADAHKLIGDTVWFWEGWVPAGNLSILAALAGVGKTRLAADLARILFLGLPIMPDGSPNPHPKGTRTLWLMYDRNWSMTADVLRAYGVPLEAILLPGQKDEPLYLPEWDDPNVFDDLRHQVDVQKPGLIVIDTITYATSRNTAKAEEAKAAFDAVIQVAADTGVTILGLAHLNKEGGVLNRRIVERARAVLMVSTPDPEGQPHRRKFWVDKTAVLKPLPLGITMGEAGNEYDHEPPEAPEEPRPKMGRAPAKSSAGAEWLCDQLDRSPMSLGNLIEAARDHGILARPTEAKPKVSLTPLYNAKDRVPSVRAGLLIEEFVLDGRKHWQLTRPDEDDRDLEGTNFPLPRPIPADFRPTECGSCKRPLAPGDFHTAWDGQIPRAECWACNAINVG